MYHKVKAYIEKYHMLDEKDKVIVGVSGGADSICLLFMLIQLKKEMGLSVEAVHVHHGLREETADADAIYVKKVCKELGIGLHLYYEDVKSFALHNKMSVEEAGRYVRRRIFKEVLQKARGTKIALAHHQNDNAETLLWNLCRGCSLKGMGGIAPVDGVFIRPLLCLKREEIESYLVNRGISYCTDETNLEDVHTRNRIRNHVIPYLEEQVNERAVSHMSETMEQMRQLWKYVESETTRYAARCIKVSKDQTRRVLLKEEFILVPEALRSYVLHEFICQAAGGRKDIESVHTKMLSELLDNQVGRQARFPYGIVAVRCYEGIELRREGDGRPKDQNLKDQNTEGLMKMRTLPRTSGKVIFPENLYTKWFDYDIIKNSLIMRTRREGDFLTITADGKKQTIKKFFINQKIPSEERDTVPLIADGDEIVWIVGYRQNQAYQITEKTKHIVEIEVYGGEENGRDN